MVGALREPCDDPVMADTTTPLTRRYDTVAGRWRDKMRVLGYYDAYLGFLSAPGHQMGGRPRVIDVGAGTGAFSEAWVAVNGPPGSINLLDPSSKMLDTAVRALGSRGVAGHPIVAMLGRRMAPADVVLAAHILEHCPDPALALMQMRDLLMPGGQLFLVVSKPHWCNAIIWLQWRHRTFRTPEIAALAEGAGLRIEAEYTFPSGPPSRTSRGFVLRPNEKGRAKWRGPVR
ncbi:MAG: methyltransferase domain-containing protein [Pseudomonadota bacterium]